MPVFACFFFKEMYVKELDPAKKNLILMSKSDLLTAEQRLKTIS